jgi:hypothetical protein
MHAARSFAMAAACTALVGCAPPGVECGADAVRETLARMTRDRAMQVVADSFPPPAGTRGKAALAAATRVSVEAPRLLLWEKDEGRLNCVASVVIRAPLGERASVVTLRSELEYRVMGGSGERFFVEIAYADLMRLVPVRDAGAPPARARR